MICSYIAMITGIAPIVAIIAAIVAMILARRASRMAREAAALFLWDSALKNSSCSDSSSLVLKPGGSGNSISSSLSSVDDGLGSRRESQLSDVTDVITDVEGKGLAATHTCKVNSDDAGPRIT